MSAPAKRRRRRLLAVASSGGHWQQLLRLRPAFEACDCAFVTVHPSYRSSAGGCRFYAVRDAWLSSKLGLAILALQLAWIVFWKERPDYVVSTGAAPGYFALRFGKLAGAKTLWIDSIANCERLSISGSRVKRYADLWLTQWPHLAGPEGPYFKGSVL
jgi:hypothetical protein